MKIILGILLVVAGIFVLALLFAFPTKWLWNWLAVDIFGLRAINVMEAWGLLVLSGLLIKSSHTCDKS